MEQNESLNVFMRLLQESHDEVKKCTDALFNVLVKEVKEHKNAACENNLHATNNLSRSLASADRPKWLNGVIGMVKTLKEMTPTTTFSITYSL